MKQVPSTVALAVVAFAMLCALLVFGLIFTDHDPGPFTAFVFAVLPSTIGVIVVAGKVDKVGAVAETTQEVAENVQHQVNGKLNAQFDAIHARLDAAGVPTQRTGDTTAPDAGRHEAPSA